MDMDTTAVVPRLTAAQNAARRQAEADRWRMETDGPHPVFAALTAEAIAIVGEYGIVPNTRQARALAWIANDAELETLADVVELIVSGRSK